MPEGAEVARVAVSLNSKLSGNSIHKILINEKSRYFKAGGIKNLDSLIFPLKIIRIYSRGKKIIFECDMQTKIIHLISSLAMSGRWLYEADKHSGIELVLNSYSVFFDDQRHFGALVICLNSEELKENMKAVGPDLLTEEVSFETYYSIITQQRIAKKQICSFLLEQKYFSGVGNWVRAEVLYESRIAPHRELQTLSLEEIFKLHYNSIKILREAFKVNGLTIQNYISPDGDYGRYRVKIYAQEKDPEGNEIVRQVFSDKRTMHWVPAVQK